MKSGDFVAKQPNVAKMPKNMLLALFFSFGCFVGNPHGFPKAVALERIGSINMKELHVNLPLGKDLRESLRAGDFLYLTGTIYTARDAAHKRMFALLQEGRPLPFDINGAVIYYAGPSPAKPGDVSGAIGPTSSYRMDAYTPALLDAGLGAMIGKGERRENVRKAVARNKAVYFGTVGGAGAYLAQCVRKSEIVAYEDLDSEAVRRLEVVDFPVYVLMDSRGRGCS